MRIGIDISQIVYEGTGVATYVRSLVRELVRRDSKNTYVLFGASFRRRELFDQFYREIKKINESVVLVSVPIPPTMLDIMWNRLHIEPVETFTGPLDVFWSSDWTQPPLRKAKGMTTIHDLSPLKFPKETDAAIVGAHRRRLAWVRKECAAILCDSEATKKDVIDIMHIPEQKLHVVYPGV